MPSPPPHALSVTPAPFPSFLRRQEPPPPNFPLPQIIPPPFQRPLKKSGKRRDDECRLSGQHEAGCRQKGLFQRSLPGGRLGGGWDAPIRHHRACAPRSPTPAPLRHPHALPVTPAPSPSRLRPLRHSCAGRNPPELPPTRPNSPQPCYHTPRRTKVRAMPTSPRANQPRTPGATIHAGSPSITLNNPEQIRTNLNKPEHRQPPRPDRDTAQIPPESARSKQPRTSPHPPGRNNELRAHLGPWSHFRHSCAGRNPPQLPPTHPHFPPTLATLTLEQKCHIMPLSPQRRRRAPHVTAVNPNLADGCQNLPSSTPDQPLRHTLNNPEQIRTNLNKPEHRQPPDQIGTPSRYPRIRPIKTTPNKPSPCLRRNDGNVNVPQSARAAMGVWPVTSSRSHWSMVSGEMSVRRARTARVSRPSVGDGWSARGAGQWRKR